ncbi:MAG: PQQ-binding-like beta-propeller repeat protein [Anaerolineales bacterium]|jgi:outer membrane protein assembly factor BamB
MQQHRNKWPAFLLGFVMLAAMLAGCTSRGTLVASSWPSVSADDTTAYVAFNEAVFAVSLESGVMRWRFPLTAERNLTFYAPPAVNTAMEEGEEGVLIIGGYNGAVYALDSGDGKVIWGPVGGGGHIIGGPAIAGELVLVPNSNGTLTAYELESGEQVWVFDEATAGLWATPLVVEDTVYVSSLDHHVYALDLQNDGHVIGMSEDLEGAIADTPTPAGDLLLVGTFNSQLVALDAADLSLRWSIDTTGWVWGSPEIDQSIAYFGDVMGQVYAINLETGQALNWDPGPLATITASPVVREDRIYIATSGGLHAYDKLAPEAAQQSSSVPHSAENPLQVLSADQYLSDIVVAGEILLVPSMNPERFLIAFDAISLIERWDFAPITN